MTRVFSQAEKKNVVRNVMLMTPILGAGIDIYTPSIPAIVGYFGAPISLVQLTVSAYLFGYGFFQLIIPIPLNMTIVTKVYDRLTE